MTGSHNSGIDPEASSASSALADVSGTCFSPKASNARAGNRTSPAVNTTRSRCDPSRRRAGTLDSAAWVKAPRERRRASTPRARAVMTLTPTPDLSDGTFDPPRAACASLRHSALTYSGVGS